MSRRCVAGARAPGAACDRRRRRAAADARRVRIRRAAGVGAVARRGRVIGVFWRNAWAPDWEHEITVGPVTEAMLPGVSIDNVVIGVAAVMPAATRA